MTEDASTAAPRLSVVEPRCPTNPLIRRLQGYTDLNNEEIGVLDHLCRNRRTVEPNATLIHEGARLSVVFVVLKGVGFRYRMLASGGRQIFSYLLAGGICDLDFLVSTRSDHNVSFLTPGEVAVVPVSELANCIAIHPRIGQSLAVAWETDGSALRDWLVNLGRRHALEKIAYFLCHISAQLFPGDRRSGGSLPMPLTQHELADTVGLTVVHANRCLQKLRDDGVIVWGRKCVTIVDRDRLLRIACSEGSCATFVQSVAPRPTRGSVEAGLLLRGHAPAG